MISHFQSANQEPANAPCWYAVHCHPFAELRAAAALESHLGVSVYLPETGQRINGQVRRIAFFPRYLFVRANLHVVTVSRINATPGVLRLIAFGDIPQPISADIIESIRERVDRLNAQGGLPRYIFRPGDATYFRGGQLRGLEAVFVRSMKSNTRARVLMMFLGQPSEVEVETDHLEPAGSEPPRQERRTRGKGRKIAQRNTA